MIRLLRYSVPAIACLLMVSCGASTAAPPVATAAPPTDASVAAAPANVGDCVDTTVTQVGPRLEGVPDSGSGIEYANGLGQVSYDVVPGIASSQVGDSVHLCLESVPQGCPPGDNRGRVYGGTNARTHATWSAPDSQHSCGGA